MAQTGYCPSGRLFEAAACGTPIISDYWEGLETFFQPGKEIIVARNTEDVLKALEMPETERLQLAQAARGRTLEEHTAERRAIELEHALQTALSNKYGHGQHGELQAGMPTAEPSSELVKS